MELLGRTKELTKMEEVFSSEESFMFLYGRYGVGKTSVIVEFIKNKRALYFSATKEIEHLHLERFQKRLAHFGEMTEVPESLEWDALFRRFAELYPEEKKVLVLDDVQFLLQNSPGFLDVLLGCWEDFLRDAGVMVLLCGSLSSVVTGENSVKGSGKKALYLPEFVVTLKIRQMRFNQVHECFPELNFSELMERYFVAGGVPAYFKYFYNKTPLLENLSKYVLEKDAPLYNEPMTILEREVREPAYYFSIMKVLSKSQQKLHDIYSALGAKANTLSPYINALIERNLIVRRNPPFDPNPEKSRRGNYYIYFGFISFWFTFVYPFRDDLEMGHKEEALINVSRSLFTGDYMWNMSYRMARDIFLWLCAAGKLDFDPGRVEKTGASRVQDKVLLPLVSMEEGSNRAFCAFAQYNYCDPVRISLLQELMEKCALAEDVNGRDLVYGLFSKTGFDSVLIRKAKEMGNVLLVNEFDVVVSPESPSDIH